jgi:hypothetical protein
MFWLLGAYASFILKYILICFEMLKIKIKTLRVNLHMLRVHKIFP